MSKNNHVQWCLFPLCCRGTTPSTGVPSQQPSTQNIKNSDSIYGKRSTFQSGSLLCSTMKQHPSSELLSAVGPTCLVVGGNGCWCLTYSSLISICNPGLPVSNPSLPCMLCPHRNSNIKRLNCFLHRVGYLWDTCKVNTLTLLKS